MYEDFLKALGLNENEAQIYEILLNTGPAPAREILKKTALKRSNLYNVLGSLEKTGLISQKLGKNGITVFCLETPDKLEDLISNKEKQLSQSKSQLASNLLSLKNLFFLSQERPVVKFYEGLSGVKKVLEDSLTSKTEIYSYGDIEAINKYIPDINKEYVKKREILKIKKRGIALDTPTTREFLKNYYPNVTETKFIKCDAEPFQTIMQIYDNKISYITLSSKSMVSVIIEDANIYQMHKFLFEHLWQITQETAI